MARINGTLWEGLALARHRLGADPDAPLRAVAIPAGWPVEAGEALAALVPGSRPVSLPRAAEIWIQRALSRGRKAGLLDNAAANHLAEGLRALLITRRAAPGAEVWRGTAAEARYVLNLPAFLDAEASFDLEGFAEAVVMGVRFLDALGNGRAARLRLGFCDMAGLLAALGLAYDSDEGRRVAAGLAALMRGVAEGESAAIATRMGAREPVALLWPAPPDTTTLPGLAEAASAALQAVGGCHGLRHGAIITLAPADAAEALLGAETAGLFPAAGSTRAVYTATGATEIPTRAALAAARLAPHRVGQLLAPVSETARKMMAEVVLPFLHAAPPAPVAVPGPPRAHVERPAAHGLLAHPRSAGGSFHASVGGHRVAMRTAEDAEGKLRELAFSLAKEGAAYRSLMDAFAQAVTIGLSHGVALDEYVTAFSYTRFGPAGVVEGDGEITQATSVLDWAFRRLAADYLGRADLPQPSEADCAPDSLSTAAQQSPLLPLDLPVTPAPEARRRNFRIVA